MLDRPLYREVLRQSVFRHRKMAFVTGPRQVGKTTLARGMGAADQRVSYHTWDDPEFRRQWIKDPKGLVESAVGARSLLILDELHKAPRWKSHLKGLYDLRGEFADIIVTGSARLDLFRRGGDSLMGRYFLVHLHPFTVGELRGGAVAPDGLAPALAKALPAADRLLRDLLAFGGFPEPYAKREPEFHRLWQRTRTDRLVREDLRDLARAYDVPHVETLAALLPTKVASLFSVQSLVEDLGVAHATMKRWLGWLESLFFVYSVPPYTRSLARALRKQPKLYLWDWSEVSDPGARFENLVAGHLRKACDMWNDSGKGRFQLHYVRDKEKREVDFLVTREGQPWLLAECKLTERAPTPALRRFAQALRPELVVQIVEEGAAHEVFEWEGGRRGYVIAANRFLGLLP